MAHQSLQLLLAASLVLVGCQATVRASNSPESDQVETGDPSGNWQLVMIGGQEIAEDAGVDLRIDTEEGRIAGRGGCNRYFGAWSATADHVDLGTLGATQMACPEPAMTLERRYIEALEEVTSFRVASETLELLDSQDRVVLRFTRTTP